MAVIVKSCKKKSNISCDFWFFTLISIAIYLGGEALCLLLAVLLHEMGHCLAIVATQNSISQLRLRGCDIRIIPCYRRVPSVCQELIILISGPMAGILGAMLFKTTAPQFSKISLLLSIFNLLPIYGLDGGSILNLIWDAVFDGRKSYIPYIIGWIVVISLFAAGCLSLAYQRANLTLIGVAVFLMIKQFLGGADYG